MNRLARALCLLLFAAFALAPAGVPPATVSAAPLGGTLTGAVTMRTMGAALPTTPLTVTLLFYNPGYFRINDEAVDFKQTQTAPDGTFAFAGLDTTPAGVYRVVVRYKGVNYEPAQRDFTDAAGTAGKTSAVRFETNAKTTSIEVPIAEPVAGAYGTGFTVVSHSMVVNEVRPQFYSVVEAYQIRNDTDRTLVGSLRPDGTAGDGVPVVFSTPTGAGEIGTQRTDLLATADLTGQKLTLFTPITPGVSDFTAAYTLTGGSAGVTLRRSLDYAAAKVQVLVSDTRQPIDSGMLLRPDAPIGAGGAVSFRPFSAENAMPGQEIQMLIGPSPPAVTAAPPAAVGNTGNILDRVRGGISSPALLALAALCFVLMIVVLRWPTGKKAAIGSRQSAGKTRGVTAANDATNTETEAVTPLTPAPVTTRPRRGRPPDADMDEAEREIEAANTEVGDEQVSAGGEPTVTTDTTDTTDTGRAASASAVTPAKANRPAPRRSRR